MSRFKGKSFTEDEILQLAKREHGFFVSLRWRDDKTRAKCFSMKKRKLLRGGRKIQHGGYYFYARENPNVQD